MRIWHQSLIPRSADTEPYFESMATHAAVVASKGTELVMHGFPPEFYVGGLTPARVAGFALGDALQSLTVVRAAIEAESQKFDAFAIATLQDPGLQLARTVTDAPVVGYGQAAALIGRSVGTQVGILAFNQPLLDVFRRRLNADVPGIVAAVHDLQVNYGEIVSAFGTAELDDRIQAGCRALIAAGADVIIPGQMLLAELIWSRGLRRIDDVPVVDGLGALIVLCEALVRLRETTGLAVTRIGAEWRRADPELLELLRLSPAVSA